jgi:UDP-N-acetyl-D-glucosamine dehydrogenase
VPIIRPTREHAHWTGTKSVEWNRETISRYDLVLISTNHANVDYKQLAEWSQCIVDTRNAMAGIPTEPGLVTKA